MSRVIDLTGRKFGRLTAQSLVRKDNGLVYWKCLCDCGKETVVRIGKITSGSTKSCGCLSREIASATFLKHGMTDTHEYYAWCAMKSRTTDEHRKGFKRYGGRGISVCEEWKNSFEQFYKDMGERPSPKHSIDRIDNDGNYEPSNCRWSTSEEQKNNMCTNIHITINGETKTPRQWSNVYGVNTTTIRVRIHRGWDPERAATEPSNR